MLQFLLRSVFATVSVQENYYKHYTIALSYFFLSYYIFLVSAVFFLLFVICSFILLYSSFTSSYNISFYIALSHRFYSATACSDPGIVYTFSAVVNPATQRVRVPADAAAEEGGGSGSFHGSDADAGVGSVSSGSSGRRKHTDTERTASTQAPASRLTDVPPVALIQCGQCSIDRPVTAAHCYECGVCVDELDHHCPVCATESCVCVCVCVCYVHHMCISVRLPLYFQIYLSATFPAYLPTRAPACIYVHLSASLIHCFSLSFFSS